MASPSSLPGTYLAVLGRNAVLSRTELSRSARELWTDDEISLLTDLQVENPRSLPKAPAQLFLDRLGGTQRLAVQLQVAATVEQSVSVIVDHIALHYPELFPQGDHKYLLGLSSYGMGKSLNKKYMQSITHALGELPHKWVNEGTQNMTSGRYFHEKVGHKGAEYIVHQTTEGIGVYHTVANQNLRNYTLRDRHKEGDSTMGMLPPKLAQILINLAQPAPGTTIVDPFCGSGTVNTEAAIMGYPTLGSDQSKEHIKMAQRNWNFLSEKFRFSTDSGRFTIADATERDYPQGVMVTEGWLGQNFTSRPSKDAAAREAEQVVALWQRLFLTLEKAPIDRIVCCWPVWYCRDGAVKVDKKILALAKRSHYTPVAFCDGSLGQVYAREGAYVGRWVQVLQRAQDLPG
ncbi:hypothetical protein H6771_00805 [Candidatus Peribacteria bacterium]|nr:hypothetical protein [Candidatus Peribacteria bacterium]